MTGRRRAWLLRGCRLFAASALSVLILSACGADPVPLAWRLSFQDADLEAQARLVEARILSGGCESKDVVYETRFAVGDVAPAPSALKAGTYGFHARVLDVACRWYVMGCQAVRLPREESSQVTVRMTRMSDPQIDCAACSDAGCGISIADSGPGPDVSRPDATVLDAGRADSADAQRDADRLDALDAREAAAQEPPPPFVLRIEAEAALSVLPPFQVLSDESALGGHYIAYPYDPTLEEPITAFRRQEPPTLEADGLATYDFEVPRSGAYRLWARVITPTLEEDSFWFKMDEQEWILWNDILHSAEYAWVDIRDFERRVQMLVFELEAGPHRLVVGYRELNARLDQLLLTDDLTSTPEDG